MHNYHPKLKTMIPLEEIEVGAQNQIFAVLNHPWLEKLIICPDVHCGYDLPIGSVALTNGVISPSFVGYDLHCGMISVSLPYENFSKLFETPHKRDQIRDQTLEAVPCGTGRVHSTFKTNFDIYKSATGDKELNKKIEKNIFKQFGTLGGGNHFIEYGVNEDYSKLYITIHSGSRKPGWDIGDYYIRKYPYIHRDSQSDIWEMYLNDLEWASWYAHGSRLHMITNILSNILHLTQFDINKVIKDTLINENHNTANLLADNKVIHRKGATPAELNQLGLIPGSMKSGVYITRGLGNVEYLSSASHGAGRKLGRNEAKKKLDLHQFEEDMKGISAVVCDETIDESPRAYKDIHQVIKSQEGLVIDVVDYTQVLVNVKGKDKRIDRKRFKKNHRENCIENHHCR